MKNHMFKEICERDFSYFELNMAGYVDNAFSVFYTYNPEVFSGFAECNGFGSLEGPSMYKTVYIEDRGYTLLCSNAYGYRGCVLPFYESTLEGYIETVFAVFGIEISAYEFMTEPHVLSYNLMLGQLVWQEILGGEGID